MTVDAFLEAAWNDHGDHPEEVADRLAASLGMVEFPAQIPPLAHLIAHVLGEHLGQWQRGIGLLESLRNLPAFEGDAAADGAITRAAATLRYAGGDAAALEPLSLEDQVSALAAAGSALAARGECKPALAAYAAALRLANVDLPSKSPAIRALAVAGNNIAAALDEKKDLDASETDGMIVAASGGLKYWKQAGTWLEEERAEYRLARSLLRAGRPEAAIHSAERCIEVCTSNNAPAFERYFGYAMLALSQRASGDFGAFAATRKVALLQLQQVPQDERKWCESDLEELAG